MQAVLNVMVESMRGGFLLSFRGPRVSPGKCLEILVAKKRFKDCFRSKYQVSN